MGDVVATVEAIGRSGEFHPITVCGRDDNLRAELEQRGYGTVIGWTDQMPALMSAADALVENAGGLTCMEAFAVGLPVITFKPIAGHGKDNAEMMARAGVNCYARDDDELHTMLAAVTRPGPERDALVDTARRLFVADPADDVEELAETDHLVDRKGRVVALRAPRGRRTAMIAAASVLVLYGGLTLGAQAVSAIGVGVAKPPKHADHTAYVGVRLDHTQLADDVLLTQIRDMGVSVVVDAQAATHRSVELEDLADQGVDIANGGWGKGSFLRWNRAHNDVTKAGKVIAREAGTPTREFCPGRRLDFFDQLLLAPSQAEARGRQLHRAAREPARAAAGGEGLRARRSRPRPDGHGGRGGRPPRPVRVGRPPRRAARGTALNPSRATAVVSSAQPDSRGQPRSRSCTRHPRSAGSRRSGVRFTPALVGVGRKGHVALTFDDGPDPESTPQFLDVLDALGWRATFFMLGEMTRRDPGRRARGGRARPRGRRARRRARQHAAAHAPSHRRRHPSRVRQRRRRHRASSRAGSGRRSASRRTRRCARHAGSG